MDQLQARQGAFKSRNKFAPEEVRRRRETQQVEIRKQKKEEANQKRRNFIPSLGDSEDEETSPTNNSVRNVAAQFIRSNSFL